MKNKIEEKKKIDEKEIKKISLEGLKYFREICEKYNLKYYMVSGTLLGAVRHKGYIPWDDDIDLAMPRKDYDKLIELTEKIENESWKLFSFEKEKKYLFPWAKLCNKKTTIWPSRFFTGLLYGISLDIFPLDALTEKNSREIADNDFREWKIKNGKRFGRHRPYTNGLEIVNHPIIGLKNRIYFHLVNIILGNPNKALINLHNEIKNKAEWDKSIYVTYSESVLRREYFDKSVKIEFEGELFDAPEKYDEFLKELYGDYMQLPPEEKRCTNHSFIAYFNE